MKDKEKITRASALRRVRANVKELRESNRTIEDIFNISFKQEDYTYLFQMTVGDYKTITYGMAKKYINSFANYFNENISHEEKYVGLLLENSPEWIYSFFGLLMAGFSPVLLSTKTKIENSKKVGEKLGISTVISDYSDIEGYKLINPFSIDKTKNQNCLEGMFANEIVLLTSGTSGNQKIVFYTGKELSEQMFNALKIVEGSKEITKVYKGYFRHLVILPFFHIFGLVAVLMWFSFFNVAFILPVNLTPKAITQACLIAKPTHIFAVPLFWSTLVGEIKKFVRQAEIEEKFNKGIRLSAKLQSKMPKFGLFMARKVIFSKYLDEILGKSVKFCITGGSFIDEETITIVNALGYPLNNGYGSTEIGITSLSNTKTFKDRVSRSIGVPFEGITYETTENESGINELYVSGKSIAYKVIDNENVISNPAKVNTFDSVSVKDGLYYISGRVDDIIVLENGENYSLALLESEVKTRYASDHIVIQDKNTKKFTLILSYDKRTTSFQIEQDREYLKEQKLSSEISNILYTFYQFPKANDIKLMRNEICSYFEANKDEFFDIKSIEKNDTKNNEINEEILNEVIAIFKKQFDGAEIQKYSDFYGDLGGDSLKYMILLNALTERFNVEISTVNSIPKTPEEFTREIMRLM